MYGYALSARAISLVNMLATVYFGSLSLSVEEQGLLYALTSIAAAQVIFELGFASVLIQFVGHERQHLNAGDPPPWPHEPDAQRAAGRIQHLRVLADRWFIWASSVCLLALLALAAFIFSKLPASLWVTPAVCTILAVSFSLALTGRWAIYEGFGRVRETLRARWIAALLALAAALALFSTGNGLYVPAAFPIASVLTHVFCVRLSGHRLWRALGAPSEMSGAEKKLLGSHVFGLQLRTSMSFLCGYATFQGVTLIAFKLGTPSLATTVGISMNLMLSSIGLTSVLMQVQLQRLFKLIVDDHIEAYFRLGRTLMIQSIMVFAGIVSAGIVGLMLLHVLGFDRLLDRLPSMTVFLLFMASGCVNQVISVQSTLVRSFKTEPYVWHSLIVSIAVLTATSLAAPANDAIIFASAYFLVSVVVALPCGLFIYFRHRRTHLLPRVLPSI